ncbi:MAG: hypothetical protein AB1896_10660 [Thermodesulfobacteriota bacterium]
MIDCPKCGAELDEKYINTPDLVPCPSCRAPLQVQAFPALYRGPAAVDTRQTIMVDGEASCFYHPNKKAVVPCSSCGRFLCALCDVEFKGEHVCPACLEKGGRKHTIKDLDVVRNRYDHAALGLALAPLLFFYVTLLTAPIVIYLVLRHWNTPLSLVTGSKIRYVVALIAALLEVLGWIVFFIAVLA